MAGIDIKVRGCGTEHFGNGDVTYFVWEGSQKVTPKDAAAFGMTTQGKVPGPLTLCFPVPLSNDHVARIAKYAESRLMFKELKVSSVTILFDSRGGLMPPAFEGELKSGASRARKALWLGKIEVTFGFWP